MILYNIIIYYLYNKRNIYIINVLPNFLLNSGKSKEGEISVYGDERFGAIFWKNFECNLDINNLYYYSYQDFKIDNILRNIKNKVRRFNASNNLSIDNLKNNNILFWYLFFALGYLLVQRSNLFLIKKSYLIKYYILFIEIII